MNKYEEAAKRIFIANQNWRQICVNLMHENPKALCDAFGFLFEKPETPDDWQFPDWENANKCHDWKNYPSENLKKMWQDMEQGLNVELAKTFQEIANREEWD